MWQWTTNLLETVQTYMNEKTQQVVVDSALFRTFSEWVSARFPVQAVEQ